MKILSSKKSNAAGALPVTREVWVVTAGTTQGRIDAKRTKTWRITDQEAVNAEEYERLNLEIREYANGLKRQAKIHWVRVEWTAFDGLRLDVDQ